MKTDVETLSPTRVRLTIEVPFDELKPSLDAAYRKVAKQVRVPGFRPGKVPPRIIDQRFGRGVVLEEAVNDAVPRLYGQAVEDKGVYVLGQPELEVTKLEDGNELAFTAEVDVRPEIEVPDYEGLPVTVDDVEVTPDEVEEQLGVLRERFAVLKGVDRPVRDGDYVSIDLSASAGGEELEDAQASGMSYQVGEGSLVEGLDDALRGMSAGESATFQTKLVAGEHAGQEAEVTVTAHSVKEKELPEFDDEFAQMASEFDTVGELRADVRSRLEQMKRARQAGQARDRALEELMRRVEIPLPDSAVQSEVQRRWSSFDEQLEAAGLTREQYFQTQDRSEEDFGKELETGAREAVKAGFLLDALAMKEELGVEEAELTDQLVRSAARMGVSPEQLAQHITQTGQVGSLVSDVLRGKALAHVLEHAAVTDASGRSVDLETLREAEQPGGTVRAEEAESEGEAELEETEPEESDGGTPEGKGTEG